MLMPPAVVLKCLTFFVKEMLLLTLMLPGAGWSVAGF